MTPSILPGTRVLVYDAWANGWAGYIKGSGQYRPATVTARYGMQNQHGRYPDLIDVVFDCGRESSAHFTDFAKVPQE